VSHNGIAIAHSFCSYLTDFLNSILGISDEFISKLLISFLASSTVSPLYRITALTAFGSDIAVGRVPTSSSGANPSFH